jgi:hypothetical protein
VYTYTYTPTSTNDKLLEIERTALASSLSPHEAWAPGVSTRRETPLKRHPMPKKATASHNGCMGGGPPAFSVI